MKGRLKNVGYYVLGVAGLLLFLLISVAMIRGVVWIGEHVLQWFIDFSWIILAVNLFVLLPLSLLKKTGMIGSVGLYISSYVFGLTLWFFALLLTYFIWGFPAVFIGLVLGGVGVVPVAMLATLLNGEFFSLAVLVMLIILTFGARALGIYLINRVEEKNNTISEEK